MACLVPLVEGLQAHQTAQRGGTVGEVVGIAEHGRDQGVGLTRVGAVEAVQGVAQRLVPEPATRHVGKLRFVRSGRIRFDEREPVDGVRDSFRERVPGGDDGENVGPGREFQQPGLVGQRQAGGDQRLGLAVVRGNERRFRQRLHHGQRLVVGIFGTRHGREDRVGEQGLRRIPAREQGCRGHFFEQRFSS